SNALPTVLALYSGSLPFLTRSTSEPGVVVAMARAGATAVIDLVRCTDEAALPVVTMDRRYPRPAKPALINTRSMERATFVRRVILAFRSQKDRRPLRRRVSCQIVVHKD